MEIERKFTVKTLPSGLECYECLSLEQAYLNTSPVIRIRRENNSYYLTYKGAGLMAREEYNLPLTEEAYLHLLPKCDGNVITKKRYRIPYLGYVIELDLFQPPFQGLILAEVEFSSVEEAEAFTPPDWFDTDVTYDSAYQNSNLSRRKAPDLCPDL